MVKKEYVIIKDTRSFKKALDHIEDSEYLAFDTETTGLNTRKDKVIGYSYSGEIGKGFYMPLYYYDPVLDVLERHPVNDQVKLLEWGI